MCRHRDYIEADGVPPHLFYCPCPFVSGSRRACTRWGGDPDGIEIDELTGGTVQLPFAGGLHRKASHRRADRSFERIDQNLGKPVYGGGSCARTFKQRKRYFG